jgi:hypothetical protein
LKTEKYRKNFAITCAVIGAAVTLVSLCMTYSIFEKCFADWAKPMRIFLALACCVAIEGTSAGLIYGLAYALTGILERGIAFVGLAGIGTVMGVNIVTHAQEVRGIALQDWQVQYVAWVGPGVLIGVFALIVIMVLVRFEARKMAKERKIEMLEVEATLDAQEAWLNSQNFQNYMDGYQQAYFEKVGTRLGLPPAKQNTPAQFPKAQSRP